MKKKVCLLFPMIVCTLAAQAQNDAPDSSREEEFHRIYKSYNEQPTSVESWENAIKGRAAENYQVQKGDTLSDISGTLFGDQFFWPKIWSLNKERILNPHSISPGMNVQFFPGSLSDAPSFGVVAGVQGTDPVVAGQAPATETPEPAIPAGKKKQPLLKNIPASLPAYKTRVNAESNDVSVELPPSKFPKALEYLGYYLADEPVQGAGKIVAVEGDMKSAGDYQYVYVQLEGGGKEFIAQKNGSVFVDPNNKLRKGQMIEIQGEIEVLGRVNDQKNTYRALVKKVIQPVEVGAVLLPGRLPMIDASVGELQTGVGAKVMGGQFENKRNLFGSNSLIFLDAGSGRGLQVGQSLPVFADEDSRTKKAKAYMNHRQIGTAKVIRVSGNFATAYVVNATEDIRMGDIVGSASGQASLGGTSELSSGESAGDEFDKDFDSAPSDSSDGLAPDSGGGDSELDF